MLRRARGNVTRAEQQAAEVKLRRRKCLQQWRKNLRQLQRSFTGQLDDIGGASAQMLGRSWRRESSKALAESLED